MAIWPVDLPQVPLLEGNEETFEDNVVRTKMDAGPDKSRMRYTAVTRPTPYSFFMTDAQLTAFLTFYSSTVSYGTLEFEFTHPETGGTESMRFVKPPRWVQIKSDKWKVYCDWELVPS